MMARIRRYEKVTLATLEDDVDVITGSTIQRRGP